MEHYQNGNYDMKMKEYDMKEYEMKEIDMKHMQPGMPCCGPQPMPHGPQPMPYGPMQQCCEHPMPQPPMDCCQPQCPPVVYKKHNVVNRYFCQVQPIVCHNHTHFCNHVITKKEYIPKYTCSEETICRVEDKGCC